VLILKRKVGERIVIGHNITIELLDVSGKSARLGIDAPPAVPVNREEVRQSLDADGRGHIREPIDPTRPRSAA
jgi:carbon storage regulator